MFDLEIEEILIKIVEKQSSKHLGRIIKGNNYKEKFAQMSGKWREVKLKEANKSFTKFQLKQVVEGKASKLTGIVDAKQAQRLIENYVNKKFNNKMIRQFVMRDNINKTNYLSGAKKNSYISNPSKQELRLTDNLIKEGLNLPEGQLGWEQKQELRRIHEATQTQNYRDLFNQGDLTEQEIQDLIRDNNIEFEKLLDENKKSFKELSQYTDKSMWYLEHQEELRLASKDYKKHGGNWKDYTKGFTNNAPTLKEKANLIKWAHKKNLNLQEMSYTDIPEKYRKTFTQIFGEFDEEE